MNWLRAACLLPMIASACASGLETDANREGGDVLAIEHVSVISMSGGDLLPDRTVVVRNGVIERVVETESFDVPPGAETVDGRGRFLLPSFVDTHVHLDDAGDLPVMLAHGIGAARNMEGAPYHLYLRDLVDARRIVGPRFFTCGPYTNAPRVATPDDAEAAAREQSAAGYDCVKIHGDLSLESLEALGRGAREAGIPVVGHVPRNLNLLDVLATRAMNEISHAEEYLYTYFAHHREPGWTGVAAKATRTAQVTVAPALVMYRGILRQVRDLETELGRVPLELAGPFARRDFRPSNNRYARKFNIEDAEWLSEYLDQQKSLVRALRDVGATLLVGTDANAPASVSGFALHEELKLLVETGLTPLEALRAGTRNGWEALAGSGVAGQVAEGYGAELVLLDANPLDDIGNTRRIAGVVARGRWLDGDALRAAMNAETRRFATDQPFVDRLWDNSIDDALDWYRKEQTQRPGFTVSPKTLACQAARAIRDGAPETALSTLNVLLDEHADDLLGRMLRGEVHALLGSVERAAADRAVWSAELPEASALQR